MTPSPLLLLAAQFKALGHPVRLRIVAMLRTGELCVCQIIALLGLAHSTVSAHLAELRRCGLLEERKQGRWVHFGLARAPVVKQAVKILGPELAVDPQVARDAALLARLRKVPVEKLCGVNLDLARVGIGTPESGRNRRRARARA